ncbi:KTSC domain-containing protein [Solirubrobacter taibaiensis]|nr:KTSC domain-containing protein [Solirubrobacter taibaiensis]
MFDWIELDDSTRVSAIAYDEDEERILVRFRDGVEYFYAMCPPSLWEEFSSPAVSKGQFIRERLDAKPRGKLVD